MREGDLKSGGNKYITIRNTNLQIGSSQVILNVILRRRSPRKMMIMRKRDP